MAPLTLPTFRGRFGVARREINPPPGIYSRNWGAAEHDTASSLHRPMTATALAIAPEGEEPLALVALDVGGWGTREEQAALREAVEAGGIATGRYLIAPSHTHSGASYALSLTDRPGGELIPAYLALLTRALREAVAEALATLRPAVLEVAQGTCALAAPRDLADPAAPRLLVGWDPLAPPADTTLLVGRITAETGEPLATLVNYACHPTILAWENRAISPDYVGALREVVERETHGAPVLFLQGASGELAARHQYTGDLSVADRAGAMLGHAVLSTLYGMPEPGHELAYEGVVESGAPLALWRPRLREAAPQTATTQEVQVPLELRFPTREELEARLAVETDRVLIERLHRERNRRLSVGDGPTYPSRHHLWRLGEIGFVSVGNEVYSELQTTLRAEAAPMPLFVITLANENHGYLAPAPLHAQDHYASKVSPFAPGTFEQTVAALRNAVSAWKRA